MTRDHITLDSFYPIFDHPQWLGRVLPYGIKLVQMRIKDEDDANLASLLQHSLAQCRSHACTMVVNDYWRIAIDIGADWVHLGQEDLDDADLAAIRRAGIKLGVSTHDHDELDRALGLDPDYIALGPVYPTILKKMKWTEQGLDKLTEWKGLIGRLPLVGIGGMRIDRADGVFAAGADIVSVVTDITLNGTPEVRLQEWVKATR
jgi:thiamine-phosphate pyrophosphorylase